MSRSLFQKVLPEPLISICFPQAEGRDCLCTPCTWPRPGHRRERNALCRDPGPHWSSGFSRVGQPLPLLGLSPGVEPELLHPGFQMCWVSCDCCPTAHLLAGTKRWWEKSRCVTGLKYTTVMGLLSPPCGVCVAPARADERKCMSQPGDGHSWLHHHCWLVEVRAQVHPSLVPGEQRASGHGPGKEESAGRVTSLFLFLICGLSATADVPRHV